MTRIETTKKNFFDMHHISLHVMCVDIFEEGKVFLYKTPCCVLLQLNEFAVFITGNLCTGR